jgi:coenzyme PQQ synthesis protein D (PqqD)
MAESKGRVHVPPSTLFRELQGETVLLQLDSGEYFGLDETATRIWQLIVEKGDLAAVEAAMLQEFDVDPAILAQDLSRLVDELRGKKLIELADEHAGDAQ